MNTVRPASGSVARLVQITDTHLYADPESELLGVKCNRTLDDVLALVKATEGGFTATLVTGDVSQDESAESYLTLHRKLSELQVPQYWIPGNHDAPQLMVKTLAQAGNLFDRVLSFGNWQVILLDSHTPGAVHGWLAAAELEFLERQLQQTTAEHVLIALHHNPVPIKAAWLQQHALQNSQDLFGVLDRSTHVRGVIFGHIHHELRRTRRGVVYLGSPSTCIQFHPTQEHFTLDRRNPGYRWIELGTDGSVITGVKRVRGGRYRVDFSGGGY